MIDASKLQAQDRINLFYTPTSGMPGKELAQILDGIDYGGVEVRSLGFDTASGWDTDSYMAGSWDTYDATFEDEILKMDGSTNSLTLSKVLEDGTVYNIYKNAIRIDDPNYGTGNTVTNKNAMMQSVTGDGSTMTITFDTVPTVAGDVIVVRKSTSDGSFLPDPETYDTLLAGGDLAYSSATGLKAEDIIVEGDDFVSPTTSKGPEEFVPGQVLDTLDIQVFDKGGESGSRISSYNHIGDGVTTNYPFSEYPQSSDAVFVSVGNVLQESNTYVVDYPNKLLKFNSAPILNYTERSFALDSPRYGRLFDDPGHREVGTGELPEFTRDSFDPNATNRIFTTRSALYDIDGQKVLIPAEGQSGMYRMDTSMKILPRDKLPLAIKGEEKSIANKIKRGESLDKLADSPGIQQAVKDSGNSLDDLEELIDEQVTELDMVGDEIMEEFRLPKDYPMFGNEMALIDRNGKRYDDLDLERIDESQTLALEDNASKFAAKIENLIVGGKGIDAPMIKDWFPMHMKTALNEAVEKGADIVRFPINDYALAKQTGQNLVPARARDLTDEYDTLTPELTAEGTSYFPDDTAKALAKDYKKLTEKGIKRIEGEYGIKLNAKVIDDENLNEFLEIEMTPELKEIFKTLVFNRGGAVRKPLMNLKY